MQASLQRRRKPKVCDGERRNGGDLNACARFIVASPFRRVHGRVIDKAQRIAAATYAPYIETGITMNTDGTINATEAADIENTLEQAILASMGDQISQAGVYVDLNQDIINTSTINIQLRIMPLGYLSWITVSLGLAATL